MPDPDNLQFALGAQYIIERELGGGGMSRVFIAKDTILGRRIVVKVLAEELAVGVSMDRFRREIEVAAGLQHPHIVPMLSSGVADRLPYYTMPYVEGETLRSRLRRGPLPIADALNVLRDVASALAYAHAHGVIHRDIKPENILLTDDAALVVDFGIAKAINISVDTPAGTTGALTSVGIALGTPAYMAPEQASADPDTDHRADIFALGIVAYELLHGQPPFAGRSPQAMLAAHVTEHATPISDIRHDVPPQVAAEIMRCLNSDPADRPQSISELLAVFNAVGTPSGTLAGSSGHSRIPRRRLIPIVVGVAATIAATVGSIVALSAARAPALVRERVVIVPFVNKTGDSSLASLSSIAADWISRSLSESGTADVAPMPQAAAVSTSELSGETIRRLSRATGAATVVGGAFYKTGDTLRFTAQIADARKDGAIQSLVPMSAGVATPMTAIESIRQRIVGAIASRLDSTVSNLVEMTNQPPSYEAYREYVTGDEAFRHGDYRTAAEHHLLAATLDSTFVYPLIAAAYAYSNLMTEWRPELDATLTKKVDSIARVLRSRASLMPPYNTAYLERVVAWNHSDFNAAYLAGRKLRGIAPHSDVARYVAARSAIPVNRMREAVDSLEGMEKKSSLAGRDARFYDDLTVALHRLGSHDRELAAARRAVERFPQRNLPLFDELRALAALGRSDECIRKAEAFLALPVDVQVDPPAGVATIAVELLWHGKAAEARTLGRRALAVWRSGPARTSAILLVHAALLSDDFATANEILQSVGEDSSRAVVIALRGVVAARQGNTALARQLSDKLAAMRGPSLYAAPLFGRARIAAASGRRDEAIELYRAAIAAGLDFTFSPHPTVEFAPYAKTPALVALMKSKD